MISSDQVFASLINLDATTSGILRVPFYFGSERMSGINIDNFFSPNSSQTISSLFFKNILKMSINPNQVDIMQEKRITTVKTAGGKVFFHWLRKSETSDEYYSNDVVKLKFKGVTGNIKMTSPGGFEKLYAFLKLRDLTAEPRLWDNQGTLQPNRQFCIMRTVAVPFTVLFIGFWERVLTITDTSESPFQKSWEAAFTVEKTFPNIVEMTKWMLPEVVSPQVLQSMIGHRNTL